MFVINFLNINFLHNLLRKCKYHQYMYNCIIENLGLICHVYHDYRLFKYSSMASGNGDMVEIDLETYLSKRF